VPLLHRRSYPRSDFRRLACKSTRDASRLRGLHLRQAAFLESGYSPRPKPLPSSNFLLLQVLALSTPATALTVAVRSSCSAFGASQYLHLSTSTSAKQLRGTQSPSSPGQVREAVLVQYPCPFDHLAMTELGVALLTVTRTFRCVDQRAESRTRRLVVSRPRASCDAGLLMPRCVSRASRTLSDARSPRVHPLRTLRCSEDRPTTVHRPQTDGHAPCSSFDAHVVLAFTVLAPAPALRRSRAHPLRGLVRRPPHAFA